jgi:hypothetical protein
VVFGIGGGGRLAISVGGVGGVAVGVGGPGSSELGVTRGRRGWLVHCGRLASGEWSGVEM